MAILNPVETRRSEFAAIVASLLCQGYRPHTDPIDIEVCRDYPSCGKCGGNLEARGYKHPNGSYVVYSVCRQCGDWEAF